MRYLRFAAIALDPAADNALLADRQDAGQVVLARVEEDQGELPAVVGTAHAIGQAPAWRADMRNDVDAQSRDAPAFRSRNAWPIAAIYDLARQMPGEIDNMWPGNLLDQLGNAGPDAGQRAYRRKQWKENIGTQGFSFLVK